MSASNMFLIGVAVTSLASGAVVIYITNPLHKLLVELCGAPERADFWLRFSNVALILASLIFAASFPPNERGSIVIEIATQLKWSLIGLLTALTIIGWVVSRFIPRHGTTTVAEQR
jgi:hypothetical protein